MDPTQNPQIGTVPPAAQPAVQPVAQPVQPQPVANTPATAGGKKSKKIIPIVIIGALVVAGAVGGGIYFFSNNGNNGGGSGGASSASVKDAEDLINNNSHFTMTNYVDPYHGMIVKYPIYNTGELYGYESTVHDYGAQNNHVILKSILGTFNFSILFPSDEDRYNDPAETNYKDVGEFFESYYLPAVKKKVTTYATYDGNVTTYTDYKFKDYKSVGEIKANDLTWKEYQVTAERESNSDTKEVDVWMTVHNGTPVIVKFFNANKEENPFAKFTIEKSRLSNEDWAKVVEKEKAIRRYIIEGISFTDDYAKMLNTREASVVSCNGGWDVSTIFGLSGNKILYLPNCTAGITKFREAYTGAFSDNTNKITIAAAAEALQGDLVSRFGTLKEKSDVYSLKNPSLNNYEVQRYTYINASGVQHVIYVVRNDDIYGWVGTGNHIEDYSVETVGKRLIVNSLDFAVKNIRYSSDKWDGEGWAK